MQQTNCSIIIPVYKKKPSESELLSLTQCLAVLGEYPISFVCPNKLDTSFYENICKSKGVEPIVERFDDDFFNGLVDYSRLLLNVGFYKKFVKFDYILLYQLDAWVFENQLEYWCKKQYDYIGAPWFDGFDEADENSKILAAGGNGGFSLRKVKSVIAALEEATSLAAMFRSTLTFNDLLRTYNPKYRFLIALYVPLIFWQKVRPDNQLYFKFKNSTKYEDIVFVELLSKFCSNFIIPPVEEAMRFSFEAQPARLFQKTGGVLPFGCHAYEKYDFSFWKPFINIHIGNGEPPCL